MPDLKAKDAAPQKSLATTARGRRVAGRFPILIPIAVVVVLLAPFLRRAFSIDDPLFIWMAEQILKHPLDPYGFSVNWSYMTQGPMSEQMQNPPLNSYFIAGVVRLIGLSELRLHLAFLLPAIAVASGTFMVARRFCARPVEATLAAVLTPAFLVCGSTVMCDMMMLAFWMWAVVFWLKGMEDNRLWMIALACVLIALSALTKYFGAVLLPLLLVYSLLAKRKPGWWLLSCLIPVLALVAYHYWTKSLYGEGMMLDAFGVAREYRSPPSAALLHEAVIGLSFAGGCIASVMFLAGLLWTRRALVGFLGSMVVLAVLFGLAGRVGIYELQLEGRDQWILVAHLAVFVVAGLSLLILAVKDLAANRDADSALLFLWLAGTLVFAGFLNWAANGRVILPMAPVAGILMIRQIDRRAPGRPPRSFVLPLILSALMALAVTNADCQFANSGRAVAQAIDEKFPAEGDTWFAGHWGFQYYMEQLGAKPFDRNATRFRLGDLFVIPANNPSLNAPPFGASGMTEEFPGSRWLSTMNRLRATAFHAAMWGPIPYGFGLTSPEIYYLLPIDEANLDILDESR